jgi:hypothetical protein
MNRYDLRLAVSPENDVLIHRAASGFVRVGCPSIPAAKRRTSTAHKTTPYLPGRAYGIAAIARDVSAAFWWCRDVLHNPIIHWRAA